MIFCEIVKYFDFGFEQRSATRGYVATSSYWPQNWWLRGVFENYIESGYEAFWLFTSRKEVKIQKDFTHSHYRKQWLFKSRDTCFDRLTCEICRRFSSRNSTPSKANRI